MSGGTSAILTKLPLAVACWVGEKCTLSLCLFASSWWQCTSFFQTKWGDSSWTQQSCTVVECTPSLFNVATKRDWKWVRKCGRSRWKRERKQLGANEWWWQWRMQHHHHQWRRSSLAVLSLHQAITLFRHSSLEAAPVTVKMKVKVAVKREFVFREGCLLYCGRWCKEMCGGGGNGDASPGGQTKREKIANWASIQASSAAADDDNLWAGRRMKLLALGMSNDGRVGRCLQVC